MRALVSAVSVVSALFFAGTDQRSHAPFAEALLAAAADAGEGPRRDDAHSLIELRALANAVRDAERTAHSRVEALNRVVFGTAGFAREVDDTDLRFILLPSVLEGRRGSCVGLGSLYIALGEQLGWKVEGVMMPGHFYVRVEDAGASQNVELLHRGEEMPDAWYDRRFAVPGRGASEYRRALSHREVLGVVEYDIGNERRRERRFSEARRAYRSSTALFPAFAEAHASLGATEQLAGALDSARESYGIAQNLNPDLPGVAHNLELLQHELHASASGTGPPIRD
jgi:regulator of sirC expression with transglutaminase-like and TPR domain